EDSLRRPLRTRSWGARVIDLSKNFRITLSFLCFGETAKPNSRDACTQAGKLRATFTVLVAGGAFLLSPGLAGGPRVRGRRRGDLRQGLRGYRVRRMIRDD